MASDQNCAIFRDFICLFSVFRWFLNLEKIQKITHPLVNKVIGQIPGLGRFCGFRYGNSRFFGKLWVLRNSWQNSSNAKLRYYSNAKAPTILLFVSKFQACIRFLTKIFCITKYFFFPLWRASISIFDKSFDFCDNFDLRPKCQFLFKVWFSCNFIWPFWPMFTWIQSFLRPKPYINRTCTSTIF